MGKAKEFMRSLRARVSPTKSRVSKSPSQFSVSTSSSQTDILRGSTSTVNTQATSRDGTQTPPTRLSITPPASLHDKTDSLAFVRTHVPPKGSEGRRKAAFLDAHEALEVNVAMLDFARRLPLDELSAVGRGLAPASPRNTVEKNEVGEEGHPQDLLKSPLESRTLNMANSSNASSSSFACSSARRVERDDTLREDTDEKDARGRKTEKETDTGSSEHLSTNSRTLSLNSTSNSSSWSFACCSARTVERDHLQREYEAHGSTTAVHAFQHPQRNTFYRPVRRSIADGPPAMEPRCVDAGKPDLRPTLIWPKHFERTRSPKRRSVDDADLWPLADASHAVMSEEEFAELPDYSDVEDDPEHNTVVKRSLRWSAMAGSHSSVSSGESQTQAPAPAPAPAPVADHAMMSDEKFEALPDWSDVEETQEQPRAVAESSRCTICFVHSIQPVGLYRNNNVVSIRLGV
jgi:hypothetical protein